MFWLPSLFCIFQLGNISYIENFSKFKVSFGLWLCLLEVISSKAPVLFWAVINKLVLLVLVSQVSLRISFAPFLVSSIINSENLSITYRNAWLLLTLRYNGMKMKGFQQSNSQTLCISLSINVWIKNLQDYLNLGNKVTYISQVKR